MRRPVGTFTASDSDTRANPCMAPAGQTSPNPLQHLLPIDGNAVYKGDSGLSSVINMNGGYSSYSNCAFLACAQDTGGENPYIDTKDVFKASDCGRLGRQAASHHWSALRVVKGYRRDYLTAEVLLEAKVAALHLERYQSSLSKLSTKKRG
jgi:hypothetical protein